jgi:cytochrome c551/c552
LIRILLIIIGLLLLAFIGIQFIPVKRTNPLVTTQLKWDSPQTQALARRACMDCHSNETVWPWYSYVAPASWLIYYDVERGRSQLNLSTLGTAGQRAEGPSVRSGDLAYQLGQLLAGGEQRREPGEGQFQPRPGGQQQLGGQPPAGGRGPGGGVAGRMSEQIRSGQMPPAKYTLIHANARLTDAERQQLIQGFTATLAQTTP